MHGLLYITTTTILVNEKNTAILFSLFCGLASYNDESINQMTPVATKSLKTQETDSPVPPPQRDLGLADTQCH